MPYRTFAVVALALATAACAQTRTGPTVSDLASKIGPPNSDAVRVIVFREKGFGGLADISFPVDLDGERLGNLTTGTFAYRDCKPGKHTLTDAKCPVSRVWNLIPVPDRRWSMKSAYRIKEKPSDGGRLLADLSGWRW
jgi:hypothetical protein